jgi:hypothetical protein
MSACRSSSTSGSDWSTGPDLEPGNHVLDVVTGTGASLLPDGARAGAAAGYGRGCPHDGPPKQGIWHGPSEVRSVRVVPASMLTVTSSAG